MPEPDNSKRFDQISMLKTCRTFTDTGEWNGLFTYPQCGWNLVQLGLVTEDKKITQAGRAALWFLGEGDDPMPEQKSFETFTLGVFPEQSVPAVKGVSRVADNSRALLLSLLVEPTDDEIRSLHDFLRNWAPHGLAAALATT